MPLDEWDPRRGRSGRQWERLKKELLYPGVECEIPECKMPDRLIVFGLRRNHPMGPSLDHIDCLDDDGHPTSKSNLRPAHFGCNSGRRPLSQRTLLPVRRTSRAFPF